jgi:cell division septation protein DedD
LKPLPVQKTAASVKQESYHPYSIMLSSCRLPQSARKIVSDYQKAGLAPYVVKVKFDNGDEWLRVLTGHYKTRREALKVKKEQQLSAAIVKKTPYTNLIGTFAAEESMQADFSRLRKSGYSPYVIKTQNGRYKLVVGAFVTKEGAENQRKELRAKGIQSQIIKR